MSVPFCAFLGSDLDGVSSQPMRRIVLMGG
jgi:hypothetical protein